MMHLLPKCIGCTDEVQSLGLWLCQIFPCGIVLEVPRLGVLCRLPPHVTSNTRVAAVEAVTAELLRCVDWSYLSARHQHITEAVTAELLRCVDWSYLSARHQHITEAVTAELLRCVDWSYLSARHQHITEAVIAELLRCVDWSYLSARHQHITKAVTAELLGCVHWSQLSATCLHITEGWLQNMAFKTTEWLCGHCVFILPIAVCSVVVHKWQYVHYGATKSFWTGGVQTLWN
jgi:Arc/MetJ family transcription regulator